jgi:hypothetical protein
MRIHRPLPHGNVFAIYEARDRTLEKSEENFQGSVVLGHWRSVRYDCSCPD